ncbi:MAG: hypothetical protein K6F51_05745 [Acetatifactor sp.]|nr:hypothetical protein [Acetatifactor sp.]
MEEKNKKMFSTILLAVGVLFIVVSGGIFVSQTWKYLPATVKFLALLAVTGGIFGGSLYTEKISLEKTSTALYYLGICFSGFTTAMLASLLDASARLGGFAILLVMSVPVVIRFLREKSLVDVILQIFLCDGMVLCTADAGQALFDNGWTMISAATLVMGLAAFVYYCKREFTESNGIQTVALLAFGIHSIPCFLASFINLFVADNFLFSAFPILLLVAAVTVVYLACDRPVLLRVLQSGALLYGAFATTQSIFLNVFEEYGYPEFATATFAAFVIGLILAAFLERVELFAACGAMATLLSFAQVLGYVIISDGMRSGMLCHPYGLGVCIALVAWKMLRDPDVSWGKLGKIMAVFGALNMNGILSYLMSDYGWHYGLFFVISLSALTLSFVLEAVKREVDVQLALKSMSLFFAFLALWIHPVISAKIYSKAGHELLADFGTEYFVILAGVAIVLLGIIWYDKFKGIRSLQFVGTCLLLAVLVIHNLAVPALPNVMLLGVVTLVMLIVATLLKKRDYAIASAATLILVALYLTRDFWMSIAWWVYLFVAGVGLVIFAIKKEKAEK